MTNNSPGRLTTKRNRNAILIIMGLLLVMLVTVDVIILSQQYNKYKANTKEHLHEELRLAASFCVEPLLKNDFISVKSFLQNWASTRTSIIALDAQSPNGFNLVNYAEKIQTNHIVSANHTISYNQSPLLTLTIKEDTSATYDNFVEQVFIIVLLSFVLVLLFSFALWGTLRRTAITPLENEIIERHKAEAKLLEKSKELKFSNQELEAYSYSIAHDLRTPLRSIVSLSQLLQEDIEHKIDENDKNLLKRIAHSGLFMSSLINDILNLSKISRHDIQIEKINLSETVSDLVNNYIELNPDKDEIHIEKNVVVYGDPTLINQLLINLLTNASKYSGINQNRIIEFGIDKSHVDYPYFIRDNGIGFNMNYVNKLFKPFQRLYTNEDISGTGIGLAICKRIVDRHHGKIWIESQENVGTTVYFTLN